MTADELREHAVYITRLANSHPDAASTAALGQIGEYLLACADALDAGPVAWMYPDDYERMKTSETFCTVFSVKVVSPDRGSTTVQLYPLAMPAPLRMPEPMTDEAIYDNDAIMAANSLAGLLFGDFATVVRAIEAETLRRVKEANE